jgi:hypothetical protein
MPRQRGLLKLDNFFFEVSLIMEIDFNDLFFVVFLPVPAFLF